ncbi:MAG: N-acetylmuramoyl-L-alanine amidase [Bacteroidales bacterium]|nr:N-acetylmuramoyl-L-alanine amidase [Bacteroidales bacterium]
MHRRPVVILLFLLACGLLQAQGGATPRLSDFSVVCDSLTARCNRRFGVVSRVSLDRVVLRDDKLDCTFNRFLSDYPWHAEDITWFRQEFDKEGEKALQGHQSGNFVVGGVRLEELETPVLSRNGKSPAFAYQVTNSPRIPLVRRSHGRQVNKGLSGRHIALWQSHGFYYNEEQDIWRWQRATLHRTVEDMFTQSYVLDYVIPMLENAGAYVCTPRERDVQRQEVICDNDSAFVREPKGAPLRVLGSYEEKGPWKDGGVGFADLKQEYDITDNPFRTGTARVTHCSPVVGSTAVWTPVIPERGHYAVYVSYASFNNSCRSARYLVHHLGGDTEFLVDQRKGGGTWVYLGTFEFGAGTFGYVELDNKGNAGEVVSADAVRFGGGMGKIRRGGRLSGMASYIEGASYWIPWAGADSTLRSWETDYTNDYAVRGAWVKMMKGRKGIPFDCSVAIHSDAGTTPNDSIVGTLSIYTLRCEDSRKFSDGGDRMTNRTFADFVQTQVVEDIRVGFEPAWNRRQLWDRSYSESRTTDVPAMLLEMLSHQNFADMRYGLDPSFRFLMGRAIYKGILKYLACRYAVPYAVQPLPVHAFSARLLSGNEVLLSWEPTKDPLEPTARSKGYLLYTRIDDGAFDDGVPVDGNFTTLEIEPGHVYSYRVVAYNDGGVSFPSEVLSVGVPRRRNGGPVLIVNNFNRVAAPAWIDTPQYAGFESRLDPGMPYVRDITYIGENYEFRRPLGWESDDAPGFGATYTDQAGLIVAGNTFDYPAVHGRSILALGLPFCSLSAEAFCADTVMAASYKTLDLICGAQITTKSGRGVYPDRFQIFPEDMRHALRRWTSKGGNILMSGTHISTDVWSCVYDIKTDTPERDSVKVFVKDVFGYKYAGSSSSAVGIVGGMLFYNAPNEDCYCCPHPDGVAPAGKEGSVWMRYDVSGTPAGVLFQTEEHKAASLGVPIECIKRSDDREHVFREAFTFFGLFDTPPLISARYQLGFLYFSPSSAAV